MTMLPDPKRDRKWYPLNYNVTFLAGHCSSKLRVADRVRTAADPRILLAYFRRFLRTSSQVESLPTIIAAAFVRGLAWKRPSGPGHICRLMSHMLQWCDTSLGDDNNASIDSSPRKDLCNKVGLLCNDERFQNFDRIQQVEMKRLHKMLNAIENIAPPGSYLTSAKQFLESSCGEDMCPVCMEVGVMGCSKCKTVRYCGKECQTKDWRAGHKAKCFKALY